MITGGASEIRRGSAIASSPRLIRGGTGATNSAGLWGGGSASSAAATRMCALLFARRPRISARPQRAPKLISGPLGIALRLNWLVRKSPQKTPEPVPDRLEILFAFPRSAEARPLARSRAMHAKGEKQPGWGHPETSDIEQEAKRMTRARALRRLVAIRIAMSTEANLAEKRLSE
jgi:hypothetical protein